MKRTHLAAAGISTFGVVERRGMQPVGTRHGPTAAHGCQQQRQNFDGGIPPFLQWGVGT